jgi:hypothetical protein
MRSSILARIPGFRQRIIPEPRVLSRGSQARGTRLATSVIATLPRVQALWSVYVLSARGTAREGEKRKIRRIADLRMTFRQNFFLGLG